MQDRSQLHASRSMYSEDESALWAHLRQEVLGNFEVGNEFESILWCRGELVVDLQKICGMVCEMNKNDNFPRISGIVLKSRDRLLWIP